MKGVLDNFGNFC